MIQAHGDFDIVVIGAGGVGKSALAHAVAHAADPKSIVGWVVVEADAQPRYRLLWSAREYALAQLERCGERAACERRHANAKLALPERSDGKLRVALHPDGPLRAADEGIVLTETAVCGIGRAMRARIGQDT